MTGNTSTFRGILAHLSNETGASILLLLAWLMTADEATVGEREMLKKIAASNGVGEDIVGKIVRLAQERDIAGIELACRILRDRFGPGDHERLMELFIGMMIADGYVSIAEQHIVRLLADLFWISPNWLKRIYRRVTGNEMPPLGDPSSPEWWENVRRSSGGRRERDERRRSRSNRHRDATGVSDKDRRALATLGLSVAATEDEIQSAYRRLAQIHHPDRFERLGQEAVDAANERFKSINAAYQYLKS